ncbi:uncharacterized protein J4E78_009429 [Alternaria triticimaculans]|uniref:uncharacterized protein n=1 Tax=Alternaria triticimaculans TaxID=297637 RepID=UPI0020C1FF93|nr:uncharacterized protein J4E78_009429 [Alternaria triticimaculans]KAI4645516.1 hypothetical protein J4E78_009429 [Alternaria triticimaculans]
MDALPGAVIQAFAHLWGQHPEVAAGIYAAGAVVAAVPHYIPNFEQAKVWYQKPIPSTIRVAKPAHTTEDAADIVESIVTKARGPTIITVTNSVSPACNTALTVVQQAKVEVLDTSSSSESIQDTSESATESSARSTASSSSQISWKPSTPRDTFPEVSSKSPERSLAKTTSTSTEKSSTVHEVPSLLGTNSSNVTNTGFKARMSRLLHGSQSSAASKESTISDTPRDVTSTRSPTVGKVPSWTTSPVVVEQLPVTSQSFNEIIDYSFETITIPQRTKTVSSAPLTSTASIDSGLKEHKSAFTHYRQHAASKGTRSSSSKMMEHKPAFTHYRENAARKSLQDSSSSKTLLSAPVSSTKDSTVTPREHKPAFTPYRQKPASKPLRDSPSFAKSQLLRWNDFRRAIDEQYITQQADQKPTKPSYYSSPVTMADIMVGYVPSILFAVCDHLYKDDPDIQEMVAFMVRNAYMFVVVYLAYAEFRLPTLPYSKPVAYARSIGSVSYNVWQKAVANFLGKQQADHFIIDRALYAILVGIAIYFLLFAGRRTREVVHHEEDESDLSEDEDMSETQDLSASAPAVIPHRKETLIRCCIAFTVMITVIWLSVYVQDLAVILASVPAVHVLSIYDEEARNTIFTILDLVVCGSYRSIIAARTWIRYYAAIAVVVYVLIHIYQPSLCADRLFRGGVAPPFSHFAVVLKLVGLSYIDSLVHGIIEVAQISMAKLRVVKAWARYKFMLIVRGRAVFPWHPKTVGGLFHWVLAIITLGPRTVFGLLPVWAGPVVMMFALWALTYAFIPLFQSLFTAIWHTIQPWTQRTSDAAAHTVKEFTTSTASIPAPVKGSTSWTAVTTTALRNWVTPPRKLTPTSRERATSSYVYTATSTERATSSRIHTTLSPAWATKSIRNATSSFITNTQKTTSSAFERISKNLSLLYRAQIKPIVSSVGTRCLSNWCQGLAYHWVWRATAIIAFTIVCTVGWIIAAQAYPAHKVRSSFTFAASFMMMYVLGTNGVLACTQDYGIIFATVLVILLLLAYWRPDSIVARDFPNEPLPDLPDEVVAPDSAPPSPPAAQIPAPNNDVGESELRNPLMGEPDTPIQRLDAQPEQAPQPPSDSQAVDLLDEDLSGLPDEVDALPTQQQASPVQTPVGTPSREQSFETPDQAQAHTEAHTADAWTQTTASLPWPQRWMTWLFDSEAARTAREKAIEAARAAAEQEHKDFLEQSGLAGGVEHEETQRSNDTSESPAADEAMASRPAETEQQHRATVEAEEPEEVIPAVPSKTATEAISAPTAQVPTIPVVADTSASVRTLTPAAEFKRTPLFEPTPPTTITPTIIASPPPVIPAEPTAPSTIAPAISSNSLIVPTPVTTPTDVPKSATDTTEPPSMLDITFDLPTIVVDAPESETQEGYTPMTFVPIEMTELATPAKHTPPKDPASEPVNAPDHQASAAGSVQGQGEDDDQDAEQDGVQESDEEQEEEEEEVEGEEEFDFGGSPTIGTSAPLQPASPIDAEIVAALEKYREEVRREAEQKKALTPMGVASGGAPAPGDGDDNDKGNGDGKDDNDSGNTPIPAAPKHVTPEPDKEPSLPTDMPIGGMEKDALAATPTTNANTTVPDLLSQPTPGTANNRPWAPFSSLPSSRTEPPMFTEEELKTQFALPAIYNRPAARPTDPKHPDSAEQWRNRLLGGPSMLTIMRREREAAARRAGGDGGDAPAGPGGPSGGDGSGGSGGGGGSDDTPSPFDPSSGSGGANPPSPSGSAGSGPMEGIDEASSSDSDHHGESDPNDGQTLDNQADTNDQMDNGNDGNEDGGDNDGDSPAQPGSSNIADIPMTAPAALDNTITADDDGDVDMSDLSNVDVDDTDLDDINMDNINMDNINLDNINLDGIDFDKIANSGFDNEQTPTTTTDDMRRQLVPLEGIEQHSGIPTSLYLSPEDEQYGEMAEQNIFADIDAYEAQNGPIKTSPPVSESQQYPTNGEGFDHLLGSAGDEYFSPTQQPSVIVPGLPKEASDAFDPFSNANWSAEFGNATQAEQDDDVLDEEIVRAAVANAFGEDQQPARDDLAPPPPTHGDDLDLEDYEFAEDHGELIAGLSNVNLDNDQSDNTDKAQVSPDSGNQRVWDSDFNKAPENAEHEYKHPDEFTSIRPRTRLVQLKEDHKIVENPEHAEYRSAGMKSLDELTGRQGQVFREVPMDTYEMRGESHDDYKDAQELMAWFDPDAEGAEPRGDASPAGSDDGSALSGEIDDDELDALAKEVEKDQLDEMNKASKRSARDVSDDSDSEASEETQDGPATPQKESSGARPNTPKKGRFRGPVSFDNEEEARFEKNDVEKINDLPIWKKLKEAKDTSTTPSPAQPSPVASSGLPTRPTTQSTLNAPSMSSSNPTSPFSYDRPPPPSPLAGGFAPGGYARSYNPVTLQKRNSTSPYGGIPTLGNFSTPRGQSSNATPPPRSPSYPAMKLPDAALSNARSLLKPASARHRAQSTAGTATTNSPVPSPAYMPMQPSPGMKSNNLSTTPPAYDPTQPGAGYTPKTASNFRAQLLPLSGLSVPQKPLPQLSPVTHPDRPAAQDEDAVGDQTSQTPGGDDNNDYDSDVDSIYGHD